MTADDFWSYSLVLYQRENAAQLCIELQDKHQCNVNILLFCLYLRAKKQDLNNSGLEHILDGIAQQDAKVIAYRLRRRQAKGNEPVYQQLKQQELELERRQQAMIVALHQSWSAGMDRDDNTDPITAFCRHYQLNQQTMESHIKPLITLNTVESCKQNHTEK